MTYRSNGPDKGGSCEYIGQAVLDNQWHVTLPPVDAGKG